MIKYAKMTFYDNVGEVIDHDYEGDPGNYWKLVKKLLGSSGTTESIPTYLLMIKIKQIY